MFLISRFEDQENFPRQSLKNSFLRVETPEFYQYTEMEKRDNIEMCKFVSITL